MEQKARSNAFWRQPKDRLRENCTLVFSYLFVRKDGPPYKSITCVSRYPNRITRLCSLLIYYNTGYMRDDESDARSYTSINSLRKIFFFLKNNNNNNINSNNSDAFCVATKLHNDHCDGRRCLLAIMPHTWYHLSSTQPPPPPPRKLQ